GGADVWQGQNTEEEPLACGREGEGGPHLARLREDGDDSHPSGERNMPLLAPALPRALTRGPCPAPVALSEPRHENRKSALLRRAHGGGEGLPTGDGDPARRGCVGTRTTSGGVGGEGGGGKGGGRSSGSIAGVGGIRWEGDHQDPAFIRSASMAQHLGLDGSGSKKVDNRVDGEGGWDRERKSGGG
ncbi:unnamed protein product, partial [Discosporangium mesarthrocarpum]